jgi:acyl-CoA synthetase (AMP-forming)/AMP-acid ligase II
MYSLKNDSLYSEFPTLIHLLQERAASRGNQIAYTFLLDGEAQSISLTYKELEQKSRHLGALLQNLGLTGERALLMYPSGLDFIIGFFACLYAGVVAVPAYPPRRNQSLDRLQAIVADCQAKEVLTTTDIKQSLEKSLENYPELTAFRWLTTDNLINNFSDSSKLSDIKEDNLAFLQYTSGSTGTPKGVMVSHGNLLHNSRQIYQSFGHNRHSHGVIWLPQYHDMGLIGGVIQPLYGGFPVTLLSPVNFLQKPLRWLEAISRQRGTTSGGPNFAYDLLCSKVTPEQLETLDLSSWEVAFTGAEPIHPDTLEAFAAKFSVCGFRKEAFYPCYGLAEATLFVAGGFKNQTPIMTTVQEKALENHQVLPLIHSTEQKGKTFVSCGQAWEDQEIRIVNPDTLNLCSLGQVGEIWVSGPSIAQGYWNQATKTAETFQAYTEDSKEGPFLRTGDLGFIDEQGELFITGRIKDVIIVRGRNHYPQDIERSVEKAHPALKSGSTAAFSIEVAGEEKLVIVQEIERTHLRKLDMTQVIASIRQVLTSQYGLQAHAIKLIKPCSLPKTSSGKIQRFLCRSKFLTGTLEHIEENTNNISCQKKLVLSVV